MKLERYKIAAQMRESGSTYREIAAAVGLTTTEGARALTRKAQRVLANPKLRWTDGLESRPSHLLRAGGFTSKDEVKALYTNCFGDVVLLRIPGLGRKSLNQIRIWLGMPSN